MTYLALASSAFVVALSGALMPGPLLAVTIGHSPRHGWTFGPLAIVGHGLLELGLVSLVFFGAGPILQTGWVQASVGLAGGGILVWMGRGMFAVARKGAAASSPDVRPGAKRAVALGLVTSLSNPYWTLWWATVGLAYLTVAAQKGVPGIAAFFAGHISGDMAWYTLVSVTASRGADLTETTFYRVLMRACAAALVLLGLWFAWYGFRIFIK